MKKTGLITLFALIISLSILTLRTTLIAGDSDDMVTVKGTFTNVTRPNITLKAEDGSEYIIHLGPIWFWEENKYELTLNTNAEVYGKLKTGVKEIYAHKITMNGTEIKLVDDKGDPLWWKDGKGRNRDDSWGMGYGRGMGKGKGCCGWRK